MYIAFTGHRDKNTPTGALDEIAETFPNSFWVHGGASGFDTQVEQYARAHGIQTIVIRPDYNKWDKNPRYAPLARNKDIVNMADRLFACYDGREAGGTKFTVEYAKKIGIPVHILPAINP